VLTGIAWDHINVFPTFDYYLEQFIIYINKIEKNGVLIYNETDEVLKKLVENNKREDIRYIHYKIPEHSINSGITQVKIGQEKVPLKVFGDHNLLNLHAAYFVCKELLISDASFAKAIVTFVGASKRLELIATQNETNVYRDFAHAPSKVKASIEAVKNQFLERRLVAILELHTFSSLNANFMSEYRGAMEKADEAIVFYSEHALELKRMKPLDPQIVKKGFQKENLEVITHKENLKISLQKMSIINTNFLFMSSGNYDGLDILKILQLI
jgi:UDP-N-acetylmuramate: L-alanyl-gamma-D-glutamyl-meso-diaminopimelate ligase